MRKLRDSAGLFVLLALQVDQTTALCAPLLLLERVGDGSCKKQTLRVWVLRLRGDVGCGSGLDDVALVDDGNTMADVAHH